MCKIFIWKGRSRASSASPERRKGRMKVTLRRLFTALLLLAVIWIVPQKTLAKEPIDYIPSSIEFDSLDDEEDAFFYGSADTDYPDIVDWESTDEKVAKADIQTGSIDIKPVGVGECDVSAIDEDGNKTTIHVTVKKKYIVKKIGHLTNISNVWYGTKKLSIQSALGASGKVVIGKDTYKFKIPEKGEEEYYSFADTTVKLKKVYKLNTKAKVTLTVKSNGVKCTYKETVKLASGTWVPKASGKKKKLTLTVSNPHKGDVVKVTYKGKTFSKKIKKDQDGKLYKVTFTLKKKLKKSSSFIVVILNKDKKVLENETLKLTNYKYEYVEPEESTEDEDSYEE